MVMVLSRNFLHGFGFDFGTRCVVPVSKWEKTVVDEAEEDE